VLNQATCHEGVCGSGGIASCPGCSTISERVAGTHWIEGWQWIPELV